MRTTAMPGYKEVQSVTEYYVASAEKKIEYPGIQQCLTITGSTPFGLIGAHVSPGSTREELDGSLTILKSGGIKASSAIYIVGNFDQHFTSSGGIWKSKAQIAKEVRKGLGTNVPIEMFNTSPLSNAAGGWGVDIHAVWKPDGVDFAWRKWPAAKTAATQAIAGPFEKF